MEATVKHKPPFKLFYIKWQDAKGGYTTWQNLDDFVDGLSDYIVESVGYQIRSTKKTIHIAGSVHVDEDGDVQFVNDAQIPRRMIIDIQEIL